MSVGSTIWYAISSCLLLFSCEIGLPVQVRDAALGVTTEAPSSQINRDYQVMQNEKAMTEGQADAVAYQKAPVNEHLLKLARTQPYYKRNRPHICSFFLKGECTRGEFCPYLHEMPNDDPELAKQNMKDRFYGRNDPVAKKMMDRIADMPNLTPPEDRSITTLYVGGVDPDRITEQDLADVFYAYGELKAIHVAAASKCAFVTYTTREAAEFAAQSLLNKLNIHGIKLNLRWGKPQQPRDDTITEPAPMMTAVPSIIPGMGEYMFPAQPDVGDTRYPSMDSQLMGARTDATQRSTPLPKQQSHVDVGMRTLPAGPVPQQQQQLQ